MQWPPLQTPSGSIYSPYGAIAWESATVFAKYVEGRLAHHITTSCQPAHGKMLTQWLADDLSGALWHGHVSVPGALITRRQLVQPMITEAWPGWSPAVHSQTFVPMVADPNDTGVFYDIAVIKLSQPIGQQTGWLGLRAQCTRPSPGKLQDTHAAGSGVRGGGISCQLLPMCLLAPQLLTQSAVPTFLCSGFAAGLLDLTLAGYPMDRGPADDKYPGSCLTTTCRQAPPPRTLRMPAASRSQPQPAAASRSQPQPAAASRSQPQPQHPTVGTAWRCCFGYLPALASALRCSQACQVRPGGNIWCMRNEG